MIDCKFTEDIHRQIYTAKDYYGRDVEIAVTIDLLYHTISADIALHKGDLKKYIDIFKMGYI